MQVGVRSLRSVAHENIQSEIPRCGSAPCDEAVQCFSNALALSEFDANVVFVSSFELERTTTANDQRAISLVAKAMFLPQKSHNF